MADADPPTRLALAQVNNLHHPPSVQALALTPHILLSHDGCV
jgi:hypothetical protein